MTGVLAFTLAALATGLPASAMLLRGSGIRSIAGVGLLLGIGIQSALLFLLSLLGIAWSRPLVAGVLAVIAATLWFLAARSPETEPRERSAATATERIGALALDLGSAVLVVGHGIFATLAPLLENDFLAIWGLKAKTFYLAERIDWPFLARPWNSFSHPDYPPLLPLAYDAAALLGSSWDDRAIGLMTTLFAVATILLVREMLEEELASPFAAALATLIITPLVLSPWIGLAEAPLIAYATSGLLLLRRAIVTRAGTTMLAAALLLGGAANVKNEGLAFLVAAVVAVVVAERDRWTIVRRLWPAFLLTLPWLTARSLLGLRTDLAETGVIERVGAKIANLGPLLEALGRTYLGRPLLWSGLLVAVLVVLPVLLRRERVPLLTIAIQLGFYLLAYLATPHSIDWHVRWSWERLVSHLVPLLVIVVLANLLAIVTRHAAADSLGPAVPGSTGE